MKKLKLSFQQLDNTEILSREQLKKVLGGVDGSGSMCNVYCGTGTGVTCSGQCNTCEDAGNGAGSKPGQDKLCA